MGKYRTVIFDMGNVLISFSHEKRIQQISAVSQIPKETIQTLFLKKGLNLQYEKGNISSDDIYHILLQYAPKPFDFEKLIEASCNIFTPRLEMINIVRQLKAQGQRLLLLSNTNEDHFHYIIKNYDFLPLFDEWILSFHLHTVKPEKNIYQIALSKAQTSAEECFYIDDIPEYIAAAREWGIKGHVYQTFSLFLETLKQEQILVR